MMSTEFDAVSELNNALEGRTKPLLIRLDEEGCIIASHFSYDSEHALGIVLRHPEGPIDIGTSPPEGEDPDEDWAESVDFNLSEGLPGLAIASHLSTIEISEVGLKITDMGGPASSAPMVQFSGELRELQDFLSKKGLPYRVQFERE